MKVRCGNIYAPLSHVALVSAGAKSAQNDVQQVAKLKVTLAHAVEIHVDGHEEHVTCTLAGARVEGAGSA